MRWMMREGLLCLSLLVVVCRAAGADTSGTYRFRIEAKSIAEAIGEFCLAAQRDCRLVAEVRGQQGIANAVHGDFTVKEGLERLLRGTGIEYSFRGADLVLFSLDSSERSSTGESEAQRAAVTRLPQILVEGSAFLNADSAHDEDSIQPYYVITRKMIEQSPGRTAIDVLRRMDPGIVFRPLSAGVSFGNSRELRLQGLPARDTLVTLDGRRVFGASIGGIPLQPDINAVPLIAVEKIEILSAGDSARYGGEAAAGTVNVVTRSAYDGFAVETGYGGTFDSGAGRRDVSFIGGRRFKEIGTDLLLAGSYEVQQPLLTSDRDFLRRGRSALLENNPDYFLDRGVPPLGARPNIQTADGQPLEPGLASYTSVPAGYSVADGLDPLRQNAGQYNLDIANSAQFDGGGRAALVPRSEKLALHGVWKQEYIGPVSSFLQFDLSRVQLRATTSAGTFLALDRARVNADAPNNDFDKDLIVSVPTAAADVTLRQSQLTIRSFAGVRYEFGGSSSLVAEYDLEHSVIESSLPAGRAALQAIARGDLDVLRDTERFPLDLASYISTRHTRLPSSARTGFLRFGSTLFEASATPVTLSADAQYRNEIFKGGTEFTWSEAPDDSPQASAVLPAQRRWIQSVSGRLDVPLLGASDPNELKGMHILGLVRWDRYQGASTLPVVSPDQTVPPALRSDFRSTNYTVGLRWSPIPDLSFRSSFGTAFQPPSLAELGPAVERVARPGLFVDSRRGNELTDALPVTGGGNSELRPEHLRTLSYGINITPRAWPHFRLTVDRTLTTKRDGIFAPLSGVFALEQLEAQAPERVIRAPPVAGDRFDVGKVIGIDGTRLNASRLDTGTWDATIQYTGFEFSGLKLDIGTRTSWQQRLRICETSVTPCEDRAGFTSNWPVHVTAVGTLALSGRSWSLLWGTQFIDGYVVSDDEAVIRNQGSSKVGSQTYHDLALTYTINSARGSGKTDIRLTIGNIFKEHPPYDAGAERESFYSAFGDPYLRTYSISLVHSWARDQAAR